MTKHKPDSDPAAEEFPLLRRLAESGKHPSADLLRACGEGVLPEEADAAIRGHLGHCAACAGLQADLMALEPQGPTAVQQERIRKSIPAPGRGKEPGRATRWRIFAVAFAVAAVALVAAVLLVWRKPAAPAQREARSGAAGAPAAMQVQVTKAPIEIPATMLPMRGAETRGTPGLQSWADALKPYKNDDFPGAVKSLGKITREFPDFADGHYYLGVAQLLLGRNAVAEAELAQARELWPDKRRMQASWYLGIAEARLGRTREAAALWKSVCAAGGEFAREACAANQRLKSVKPQ